LDAPPSEALGALEALCAEQGIATEFEVCPGVVVLECDNCHCRFMPQLNGPFVWPDRFIAVPAGGGPECDDERCSCHALVPRWNEGRAGARPVAGHIRSMRKGGCAMAGSD